MPGQVRERSKVAEPEVAGNPEHRGIEVPRGAVNPGQEGRELQLADRHLNPAGASRAWTICSRAASPLPTVSSSNRIGPSVAATFAGATDAEDVNGR